MIYLELLWTFFKIGLFTFGGGYAMLPLIQEEVISHGWMTDEQIINFIAVSESTPGPFAINIATYIGTEMGNGFWGGLLGAFCATLGVVLPSFIIILIVAKCFEKFKTNKIISGCMTGLKPAVIGLIASAVVSMAHTVFFPSGVSFDVFKELQFYILAAIALVMAFLAIKKVHPILIICISAVIGIGVGYGLGL
ncbi:MAG: chromate transporter [Clostridia bacterium]|nr:chromate transporter [Clostridia bacterium]